MDVDVSMCELGCARVRDKRLRRASGRSAKMHPLRQVRRLNHPDSHRRYPEQARVWWAVPVDGHSRQECGWESQDGCDLAILDCRKFG